jgi:hypothetical protein
LFQAMKQRGLLPSADSIEDIVGTRPILGPIKPVGGHLNATASSLAEVREWFVRGAHYISSVDKKLKAGRTDLKAILDESGHEVRKWHPTGLDLTSAEKAARLVIPFYSWQRKVIPLLIQGLVQRPAKILAYPRAQLALQQAMGIQGGTIADPFPDDNLYPEWIRAYGIGPIGEAGDSGPSGFWGSLGKHLIDINGNPYGTTIVNPGDPFTQTFESTFGYGRPLDAAQALYGNLTPAIQIPSELAFGQTVLGAPINSNPLTDPDFVGQTIPALAPFARVFNGIPGIGNTRDYNKTGQRIDIEALLNVLTGAGIRGTAPYVLQAQLEQRDRANGN